VHNRAHGTSLVVHPLMDINVTHARTALVGICSFIGFAGCSDAPPHDPITHADLGGESADLSQPATVALPDLADPIADVDLAPATTAPLTPFASGAGSYFVAQNTANETLYAYRIGVVSTGLHLATVSATTGVFTPLYDDAASQPPLDVQADATSLYFNGVVPPSQSNYVLRKVPLAGGAPSVLLDVSGIAGMPTGSTIQSFLVTDTKIYILSGSYTVGSASKMQLGTIALGGAYTKITDVTYPGAETLSSSGRDAMTILNGKVYAAIYATFPSASGAAPVGFISEIDPVAATTKALGAQSAFLGAVTSDATRVYFTDHLGLLKAIAPPSTQAAPVATIPPQTHALRAHGGALYGVALGQGHVYTAMRITPPDVLDGSGVVQTLVSVAACQVATVQCHNYNPTLAVDDAYAYFTNADGIFKVLR